MGLRNRTLLTEERCFFVTTTCYQHLPLLFDATCFTSLFDSFRFYNEKYRARLLAYVFMTNHVHFILFFEENNHPIAYVRDYKKSTSLKLRERIQSTQPDSLVSIKYEYRTQHFKIGADRFDDVYLRTRDICETKIHYMHNNPVRAGLVSEPTNFLCSSAAFYDGKRPKSQLMHYRKLF